MIHQSEIGHRLRHIDYLLAACVLLIAAAGVLAIRSATHDMALYAGFANKQAIGIAIGAIVMLGIGLCDYSAILPRIGRPMYLLNLLLLAVVLKVHGSSVNGSARWIPIGHFQFQPSEFAKLAVIVSLALYIAPRREKIGEMKTVLGSLAVIALPFALIFKQPDLGTGLVVLSVWLGMIFVAGAQTKHLAAILACGVLLFGVMWHFNKIKSYQIRRLTSFINPSADSAKTGYHVHESKIAIGAGQLTGQGYERGIQERGHFIPEQHTDFIFTIVGEEGGFITSVALLLLYLFCLERAIVVIVLCEDFLGRLLVAGVVSMLAFHILVNVGMTMGVVPVAGVPLAFFSYGLSALLIDMSAVGLVLSVAARRRRSLF